MMDYEGVDMTDSSCPGTSARPMISTSQSGPTVIHSINQPGQAFVPAPLGIKQEKEVCKIDRQILDNPDSRFLLKEKLQRVFFTLNEFDPSKKQYAKTEVATLLATYILKNKERFFDTRNILVAIVKNDPLGEAFGVNAFHRTQTEELMVRQLVYVDNTILSSISKFGEGKSEGMVPPF